MQQHSTSAEQLQAIARDLIGRLVPGRRATIVALSGDLGAGKTTFVQGAAKAVGVSESVQSPTFVLEKIYRLDGQKFSNLVHIDAYRLKGTQELSVLGWDELIAEPSNLILVEWPEQVPGAIPEDAIKVRFDIDGSGRRITINDGEKNGS